MKVCLFWNRGAGEGQSLAELTTWIESAGHRVDRVVRDPAELPHTSHAGVDAVVAAGGDGTVALVARALAGGDVPLSVLPLGTANNIADSLGIHGAPQQAIAEWMHQQIVRIDAGIVQDGTGECPFFESVGAGLIADAIANAPASVSLDEAVPEQLRQARDMYVDLIGGVKTQRLAIDIDGTSIEDDYLLVEVLNMPSVGPNIRLTSEVNPADGLLSVVVAAESDRPALAAYLRARATGEPHDAELKSWRGRRIVINGMTAYHVDDQLRTGDGRTVTIGIKPGHLPVLA